MTLNLSENSWAKAGLIAAALVAAVFAWSYIAGGIFLLAYNQSFDDATPLTLYRYWIVLGADKSAQLRFLLAGLGALILVLAPIIAIFAPAKRKLHGDARFATRSEIKNAGLFGEIGIIVGQLGKQFLMMCGQQHAMLTAPTRGGKGVGVVIPNLLNWPESVVVLDIKQENWDITSGYRKLHGQECYLFNPATTDGQTHRYNPLAYINDDPNLRLDDIQKIANMLFPDTSEAPIWTATPRSLFLGIVLYLVETPDAQVTMGQVLRETQQDGDCAGYFSKIIKFRQDSARPLSGSCIRALNTYLSINAEATRSGVLSSFQSRLELWNNPLVDAATSGNDFDLREVRKRRMSIYLGITPDNLARMAPLLNLFFQQLIDLNTRVLPSQDKTLKYTCLLLMDEFKAIGKIGILATGISYIAGYGLRVLTILQTPVQLEIYGAAAAQEIDTNHALKIIYPPKASETKTARDISEWLGYQTVKGKSETTSKGFFASQPGTENSSDQRRALLLPQEITSIGKTRELIIMENVPPILAKRVVYFKDARFIDRLKEVSPRLRALGTKIPKKTQLEVAVAAGELRAPVPRIDLEAHHQLVNGDGERTAATEVSTKGGKENTMQRAVTVDDVPKLNKLSLANFAVDFSSVAKPRADELTESALHAYADSLCTHAGITL